MANDATHDTQGWFKPAFFLIAAITAARVAALWFNRMDLFVDEAQYWLWGQELAFGYYSKPPMIGWVIRGMTELAGSDAPFWVRLPAPLLHGITALVLGAIAARSFGRKAALLVAAGYATLPMVSLASILMSTDTIMFPFLALALLGYLALLDRGGLGLAALTGIALGLAFMSKYAAVYYIICAVLAAVLMRSARPKLSETVVVLILFAATILPNILWNLDNGMATLEHTMDNADWVRDPGAKAGLNFDKLGAFLGSQFAVFGPVLFGGLIWLTLRARSAGAMRRELLIFTLPVLMIVCVQAVLSNAYANWAAAAYLAGTVAVIPWLTPFWRAVSFTLNGAIAIALPLIGIFADTLTFGPEDRLLAARYVHRADLTEQIADVAKSQDLGTVVAQNRDLLADFFYSGRDSGLSFYAIPPKGRAPHHYALKFPLPADLQGDVLFADRAGVLPVCTPNAVPLMQITPTAGAHRKKTITLYRAPATCWSK